MSIFAKKELTPDSPTFGLRMRVMSLLGISTHRLGSETRNRATREDDRERFKRLGPQEGAIKRAQSRAAEIEAEALRIAQ